MGNEGQEKGAPGASPDPSGPDPERPGEEEVLKRLIAEAKGVGRDLVDLLRIAYDRARLGARSGASRLAVLTWVGLVVSTATVVATYYAVQGFSGLMTEVLGTPPWGGRLAAGVLVLAVIVIAAVFVRFRARRAGLRRLEARYAETLKPGD